MDDGLLLVLLLGVVALAGWAANKFRQAWGRAINETDAAPRLRPSASPMLDTEGMSIAPRSETRPTRPLYFSDYIPPELEPHALRLDADGLPNVWLSRYSDDTQVLTTEDGLINPLSRRLAGMGIYSFQVRGASHYSGMKQGDCSPGVTLQIRREASNEHDPNAVAIHSPDGIKIGYVNRAKAKPLAQRIDSGENLEAISMRGDDPGVEGITPYVLIASPAVVRRLRAKP